MREVPGSGESGDGAGDNRPIGQCGSCGYSGPVEAVVEVSGRAGMVILTLALMAAVGIVLPVGDYFGLWSSTAVMTAADDADAIGGPGLILLVSVVGLATIFYGLYRRLFRPLTYRCPRCRARADTTIAK